MSHKSSFERVNRRKMENETTTKRKKIELDVKILATKAYDDQKPGTSGLRKRTRKFMSGQYLNNFVASTFEAIGEKKLRSSTLVVGGDGRFYNKEAIRVIVEMAAAYGVGKLIIGKDGLMSTPALSAMIRARKALGGIILTASHNPGGIDEDFGIKYNVENGGPAPESVTSEIYRRTQTISRFKIGTNVPTFSLSKCPSKIEIPGGMIVEIVDPTLGYVNLMKSVFDFDAIKKLLSRKDFSMIFDGLHGVAGPYVLVSQTHTLQNNNNKNKHTHTHIQIYSNTDMLEQFWWTNLGFRVRILRVAYRRKILEAVIRIPISRTPQHLCLKWDFVKMGRLRKHRMM